MGLDADTIVSHILGSTAERLPGLYPPGHVQAVLERMPTVRHHRIEGFNHYTIVLSHDGAAAVAGHVREALAPTG